jgi:hypothetical protein
LDDEVVSIGLSILPEHFFDIEEAQARMVQLLVWLPSESHFRHLSAPVCAICGTATRPYGFGDRTHAEVQAGVFNVRLYRCTNPECAAIARIPRHSSLARLLEVWRGEQQELLQSHVFFWNGAAGVGRCAASFGRRRKGVLWTL